MIFGHVYFTTECVASSADGQGIHGWAYIDLPFML